ncbi:sugar phosphate isomerase/epimerase [Paenibacillus oryzisoli]|uniref:sugar phosphate isomerase/epimerase family protein n=1 Tax=Paenibacillus oryzisoli TaxID=1850517 RepID=UPI003D2E48D2
MKLGISSYTLTWSVGVPGYPPPLQPIDACGLLTIAREEQVALVQIADNLPLQAKSDNELLQLRRRAEEINIELEIGTRGTDPDHLRRYLQIARLLNSKLVRTLITTSDLSVAARDLAEIEPEFAHEGVLLAIENHGLHTTNQLIGLFQQLNSAHIGCCLDTVNSFGALEDPQRVIDALTPYLVNLHIKDFDIQRIDHQMGFSLLGTPAGAGRLDLNYLFGRIAEYGKTPTAILELWTPYCGTTENTIRKEHAWMKESLSNLRKYPLHYK